VSEAGKSCQSCHGPPLNLSAAAVHYPRCSDGRVIDLEQWINRCRSEYLKTTGWAYESPELLALTRLLSHLAKGRSVEVTVEGPAAASFERGKQFFYQRRGQLNLSCANCHEQHRSVPLYYWHIEHSATRGGERAQCFGSSAHSSGTTRFFARFEREYCLRSQRQDSCSAVRSR